MLAASAHFIRAESESDSCTNEEGTEALVVPARPTADAHLQLTMDTSPEPSERTAVWTPAKSLKSLDADLIELKAEDGSSVSISIEYSISK